MFSSKKTGKIYTLSGLKAFIINFYLHHKTLILTFLCIIIWVLTLPELEENYVLWGLDDSWLYLINIAASKNYVFGRDIIFTYGPMGFLFHPLNIDNNILVYLMFTAIAGVYAFYALHYYIVKKRRSLYSLAIVMVILIFFRIHGMGVYVFSIFFLSSMLICDDEKPYFNFSFLCLCSAFMWMVKFDMACLGLLNIAIVIFSVFVKNRIERKSFKRTAVFVFLSIMIIPAFVVMYLIYNPSMSDMISYIKYGLQLSSGYNYAMSLNEIQSNYFLKKIAIYACLYIVSFLITFVCKKAEVWKIIMCAPFFLFAYKYGVVRCDSPHMYFLDYIMTIIGFWLIITLDFDKILFNKKKIVSALFFDHKLTKFVLVCLALFMLNLRGKEISGELNYLIYNMKTEVNVRRDKKLPDEIKDKIGNEKALFYPWDILKAECDDIDFVCPPVIQGYAAYTHKLDELNAIFFESDDAPKYIVFEPKTIDERYMPWEAPKTTFAIETHYQLIEKVEDLNSPVMLLEKRTEPLPEKKTVQTEETQYIGSKLIIPETAESISISIKPTVQHKLLNLFYRTDPVYCEIEFSDGTSQKYRVISEQLSSKLPLQCNIFDTGNKVTSIKLCSDTLHYVNPELTVKINNCIEG